MVDGDQRFRDWRDDDTLDQILERWYLRLNEERLMGLGLLLPVFVAGRKARQRRLPVTDQQGNEPRRPDRQDSPDLRCQ